MNGITRVTTAAEDAGWTVDRGSTWDGQTAFLPPNGDQRRRLRVRYARTRGNISGCSGAIYVYSGDTRKAETITHYMRQNFHREPVEPGSH